MDVRLLAAPDSNVKVSLEHSLEVKLDKVEFQAPLERCDFEETVSRIRRDAKALQGDSPTLTWVPAKRPTNVQPHKVLEKLYDMAWHAHATREHSILTAFSATLTMKVDNTHALCGYAETLRKSAAALSSTISNDNMSEIECIVTPSLSGAIREAQAALHTKEDDPQKLLELWSPFAPSTSSEADLETLGVILPSFADKHATLKNKWKRELDKHAATLSARLVATDEDSDDSVTQDAKAHKKRSAPSDTIASVPTYIQELRRAVMEMTLRLQTIAAIDDALESAFSITIASQIAKEALEIQEKEDRSFRRAKDLLSSTIATIDETIARVERELARAYNQGQEYKKHLLQMKTSIEVNLDAQRKSLYAQALRALR